VCPVIWRTRQRPATRVWRDRDSPREEGLARCGSSHSPPARRVDSHGRFAIMRAAVSKPM